MKRLTKNKEIKLAKFAEELTWLMDSYKEVSIKDICIQFLQQRNERKESEHGLQTNTAYLVGVLPSMFQDKDLFPSNSDLSDFAADVLELELKNSGKKSRMEMIGTIVCEVANSNSAKLDTLVDALDNILGNESKLAEIKKSRFQPNFSWNTIISSFTNK